MLQFIINVCIYIANNNVALLLQLNSSFIKHNLKNFNKIIHRKRKNEFIYAQLILFMLTNYLGTIKK